MFRLRASFSLVPLFVAAVLLAGFMPGDSVRSRPAELRSHAAVGAWMAEHPGQPVPVIITADPEHDAESLAATAGASVYSSLGMINGVGAFVPANGIELLATADGVQWISLDGPISSTDSGDDEDRSGSRGGDDDDDNRPIADTPPAPAAPANVYAKEIRADQLWSKYNFGQGIGIAVVDTGIASHSDFFQFGNTRITATVSRDGSTGDGYGHGTHVAGLIGGNGTGSNFKNVGIAPGANLIDVKIGTNDGEASVSDVITGLQFVLENRAALNIRVVNLSLRSDTPQSYKTDPLDAAVELLTFNGILVVVAAGNTGTAADAVSYAPANDPFVLTVGAADDRATTSTSDDIVPVWSSRGITQDGFAKPEVYTPGRKLLSTLSPGSDLAVEFPQNVYGNYFQLSGTSMAAGVASGAAALVFQANPTWTPGQVRLALIQTTTNTSNPSARLIQVDKAADLKTAPVDVSLDILPNDLLLEAAGVAEFDKISWSKISWSKISWSKISWSKISWSKISWSKISWGNVEE